MSADIISLMSPDRREVEGRYREQLDLRMTTINELRAENRTLRALRTAQAERLIAQGAQLVALHRRHRLAIALAACGWTIAAASAAGQLLRWIGP